METPDDHTPNYDTAIVPSKTPPTTNQLEKNHSLMSVLKDNLTCEMYHALLDVFDSRHYIIKAHLSLFLLISYGLAAYMTTTLIINYFNYGVITSIRTINETPSPFPKVTICNLNQFTTRFAYDFLSSIDTEGLIASMANMTLYDRTQTYWKLVLKASGLLANQTNDFKTRLGHSLGDSLISCQFNYQQCSPDDFTWSFDSYYGNCFSFNSGLNATGQPVPLKHSNLAGFSYGLQIDFYVNFYEELAFFNSIMGGKGAVLRMDNHSHVAKHVFDGCVVMAGAATSVALKREIKSILPWPYSDCVIDRGKDSVSDTYLFNQIKNSPYDYTQQFCIQQCMQQLLNERCNCGFAPFATILFPKACIATNETECALWTYHNVYDKNDYSTKVCLPQCPLECNSTQIIYSTTSYELLGDGYVDYIRPNANLSADFVSMSIDTLTAKQSMVRVYVYYDSLSYEQSDEAPQIDIVSLIANIGGNLGLFLGVSMFSVCELVTTLIEVYFYKKQSGKVA